MVKALITLLVFVTALTLPSYHSSASTQPEPSSQNAPSDPLKGVEFEFPLHMKVTMTQQALGTFGIGGGPFDGIMTPQTQRAIQTYQKIRGLPLTDTIDAVTFKNLMEDFDEWRRHRPLLPVMTLSFSEWDKGYISAIGTWASEAAEWNPDQATSLFCWRDWKLCVEATAEHRENTLLVSQRTYLIEEWNENEIVTAKKHNSCPVSTVHIIRSTQEVTGTRFPDQASGTCAQRSPSTIRLVDGFHVYSRDLSALSLRFKPLIQAPGFALPQQNEREDMMNRR